MLLKRLGKERTEKLKIAKTLVLNFVGAEFRRFVVEED